MKSTAAHQSAGARGAQWAVPEVLGFRSSLPGRGQQGEPGRRPYSRIIDLLTHANRRTLGMTATTTGDPLKASWRTASMICALCLSINSCSPISPPGPDRYGPRCRPGAGVTGSSRFPPPGPDRYGPRCRPGAGVQWARYGLLWPVSPLNASWWLVCNLINIGGLNDTFKASWRTAAMICPT